MDKVGSLNNSADGTAEKNDEKNNEESVDKTKEEKTKEEESEKKQEPVIDKIDENPVLEAGGDGMSSVKKSLLDGDAQSSVRKSVAAPSMRTPLGSNPQNKTDNSFAISKAQKSKTDDDDLFGGAEIKSSVDMDKDEIMAKIDDLQKQINQIKKDGVGKSTDKIKRVDYGNASGGSTPIKSPIKDKPSHLEVTASVNKSIASVNKSKQSKRVSGASFVNASQSS